MTPSSAAAGALASIESKEIARMKIRYLFLLLAPLLSTATGPVQGKGIINDIKNRVVQQMVKDGEIDASCANEEGPLKIVDVNTIELNGDGTPELLITGQGCACQGARRCAQWIYRSTKSGYEWIFGPDQADSLTAKKASSKGYRDIESTGLSGNDACTVTYKFDGRRYQKQRNTLRCAPM